MNCLECQELLQKRLDGDSITAAETLEQHLSLCATCREQHTAAARLIEGLAHTPAVKAPAGFTASLVAEVLRDRRVRREKVRRRVFVTMALAASVLLMLLAAYMWMPREANNEVKPRPFVEGPKKVPDEKKQIAPKANEQKNALAALTERWAGSTRDHAKVVLVAANLDGVEKLPAVNEIAGLDAGQEVSGGVRTVTRGARKAFDFFAREMPMPEIGEHKN